MANNTIINMPTPKFGVNEVVYLRESALLGYLEPLKIYNIRFDADLKKIFYVFVFKKNAPNTQIAGDAIDLKSGKSISIIEDELLTYEEALVIKVSSLERELQKTRSQLLSKIGLPSISITEQVTEVTNTNDFGDVMIGSATIRQYMIMNDGDSDLILNPNPNIISILGDPDFTLDSLPSSPISPNDVSTFDVRFAPSVASRRVAVIQVLSNDPENAVINITIEGSGVF